MYEPFDETLNPVGSGRRGAVTDLQEMCRSGGRRLLSDKQTRSAPATAA